MVDAGGGGRGAVMAGVPAPSQGWRAVAGCFLVLTLGFAAAYSYPAFAGALAEEFAASPGGMSMVFALSSGTLFLVSAIAGPLADRAGPRRVAAAGMALIGSGLALATVAESFAQLLFCYGGMVGLGLGLAYVPAIAAVQRGFVRRRGLASGLACAGIGIGTALVPAVGEASASLGGWRDAFLLWGALVAGGGAAAAALLGGPPRPQPAEMAAAAALDGPPLRAVLESRRFALLYAGTLLVSVPMALPFAHLVASAQGNGVPRGEALALIGIVGLGSLPGRVLLGLLADRVGRRPTFLSCCAGVSGSTLCWAAAADGGAFGLFAAAFGVAYGGFVALLPAFAADLFGRRAVGGTIGVLYTSRGLATLAATPAVAAGAAAWGGYALPLAGAAALGALGTGVLCLAGAPDARRPRRRRQGRGRAPSVGLPYRAAADAVRWMKP